MPGTVIGAEKKVVSISRHKPCPYGAYGSLEETANSEVRRASLQKVFICYENSIKAGV